MLLIVVHVQYHWTVLSMVMLNFYLIKILILAHFLSNNGLHKVRIVHFASYVIHLLCIFSLEWLLIIERRGNDITTGGLKLRYLISWLRSNFIIFNLLCHHSIVLFYNRNLCEFIFDLVTMSGNSLWYLYRHEWALLLVRL